MIEEFHCENCGADGEEAFYYSWTSADLEHWVCKKCEDEILVEIREDENEL